MATRSLKIVPLALGLLVASATAVWASAVVGESAPDFTLDDTRGRPTSLSEFHGKYVVIEWFNHQCPFTRKHYDSGNMQALQERFTGQGVVWLSINSGAAGKEGYTTPEQAEELTRQKRAAPTAVLLDHDGTVGHLYGARTTPHVFLIDPAGRLIYAGALDDKPTVDVQDAARAENYLERAFDEAKAGKPISKPLTQPYGCSVKY